MSHKATNWAFQQRKLSPAVWRVLVMLADRHNPDHGCFPSQEQLAVDCEMSRRSVNRHLDTLEAMGLIRRAQTRDPATGRQRATRYILGFEDEEPQEPCAKLAHGPCAKSGRSRVPQVAQEPVSELVITTPSAPPARDLGPTMPVATTPRPTAEERCLAACGPGLSEESRRAVGATRSVIDGWIEAGCDLELDILPVLRARTARPRDGPIRTWGYFTPAVRAVRAARLAGRAGPRDVGKKPGSTGAGQFDFLRQLADWLNSDCYVPPSAVTNTQRRALLAKGLVSEATLRARQIY